MANVTINDWRSFADTYTEQLEEMLNQIRLIKKHMNERVELLKMREDWQWRMNIQDGEPRAEYWDNATAEEREMLDYAAAFQWQLGFSYEYAETAANYLREAISEMEVIESMICKEEAI